jgi:hypothetical protein
MITAQKLACINYYSQCIWIVIEQTLSLAIFKEVRDTSTKITAQDLACINYHAVYMYGL